MKMWLKSIRKLLKVAEMNEKMLDCAHYPVILCKSLISTKQGKLAKHNRSGLDSSIVYRRE